MGPKVTVDSSTLMNKGLEVIEAHELFGVAYDRNQCRRASAVDRPFDGHVHRRCHDRPDVGSGHEDCRSDTASVTRTGRAIAYGQLDWQSVGRLDFEQPDRAVFRCLELAESAGREGGLAPAWLNAGNEVAVAAFLEGRISLERDRRRRVGHASRVRRSTCPTDAGSVESKLTVARGFVAERAVAEGRGCVTQLTDPVRIADRRAQDPESRPRTPGGTSLGCSSAVLAVIVPRDRRRTQPTFSSSSSRSSQWSCCTSSATSLTAKWSGMKVTEYFLGFGPRLWSFRRGETEYGVKALPLGGYVKIIGMSNLEEVPPEDEPRTYRQQPFRKRLLVAVAGSAVHFILAADAHLRDLRRVRAVQQPGTVQVQASSRGRRSSKPGERGRDRAGRRDRLDQRPPSSQLEPGLRR